MPRPLRVLALINSLGYGGAERMLERLVLSLTASGRVEYTVCSLEGPGPIGERLGKVLGIRRSDSVRELLGRLPSKKAPICSLKPWRCG